MVAAIALAALRFFDGAALDRDGNILAIETAADAVAGVATHGFLDGAAGDGDIGSAAASVTAADVTAADAGTTGACVYNPEPLADFIDFFSVGEGEESTPEILELYRRAKREGWSRSEFLRAVAQIEGAGQWCDRP